MSRSFWLGFAGVVVGLMLVSAGLVVGVWAGVVIERDQVLMSIMQSASPGEQPQSFHAKF